MGEREPENRAGIRGGSENSAQRPMPAVFSLKNIAILVLGVVASSFLAIYTVGNYLVPAIEQRRSEHESRSSNKRASELENLTFYRLDPVIVNPANTNGERYLKAKISFKTDDQRLLKEIDKRLPQIKDQINGILSSKTIDQIQTNQDRERLRREIQSRVNGLLLTGRISNVYFEEFVYQ